MAKVIEIFKADVSLKQPLPLYLSRIKEYLIKDFNIDQFESKESPLWARKW